MTPITPSSHTAQHHTLPIVQRYMKRFARAATTAGASVAAVLPVACAQHAASIPARAITPVAAIDTVATSNGHLLAIPRGVVETPLAATRRVPMEVISGHIYVRATIDGRSGLLLLDTGAPVLFLNTARLSLSQPVDSGRMGDATGTGFIVRQHRVSSFTWAGMTIRDAGALTLDMRTLEEHVLNVPAKDTVLGILGLGQLTPFTVVFDYAGHELLLYPSSTSAPNTWGPLPSPTGAVPVVFTNSAIAVPVRSGKVSWYLKLDTGSEECILDGSLAPLLGTHLVATGSGTPIMGGGNRVTFLPYATLDQMSVGPVAYDKLRVQLYPSYPINTTDSVQMRGLLGATFFAQQRIGLSVQARTLYVWNSEQ